MSPILIDLLLILATIFVVGFSVGLAVFKLLVAIKRSVRHDLNRLKSWANR
jgi:hypothetical protein